jgi:uncharacterized protein (DUF849 family)
LASAADAERLVRLGLGALTLRVLVEIEEQVLDAAMAAADAILAVLARASLRKPVLLHGFDATVWPFVERAARQGFSTRVGLEDGFALPDGTAAPSNAALVAAAAAIFAAATDLLPTPNNYAAAAGGRLAARRALPGDAAADCRHRVSGLTVAASILPVWWRTPPPTIRE